jgi:hypothetical protein
MQPRFGRVILSTVLVPTSLLVSSPATAKVDRYNFCNRTLAAPKQKLTDAIASFLNPRYQGRGVKDVTGICSGPNPNIGNQKTWIYRARFKNGTQLDVAIYKTSEELKISVRQRDGWTAWTLL